MSPAKRLMQMRIDGTRAIGKNIFHVLNLTVTLYSIKTIIKIRSIILILLSRIK